MTFTFKLSQRLARMRHALVVGVVAAAGCTADQSTTGPVAPTSPDAGPLPAVVAGTPQFGHVFMVTLENTNYSSVIGSSSMPYLNSLASQYSLATQYYANTHPSIGNYFMLATGQIITNNDSYSTIVTADNIVRQLLAAGKTWKSYAEDLPSVGYTGGDVGQYARKHNIFALLSDVANNATQRNNLVPFTQFPTDLANGSLPHFSNIVPNLCNDGHDCGLSTADTWLRNKLTPLIASSTFQQDGLLIIVFDESGGDNTNGGGRIVWVAVGPQAKRAYQSTTNYQHQSTLRLILSGLGVSAFPGAAASAPAMGEFFQGTVVDPPPVPAACQTSSASWLNTAFASQTGSFTAQYDVTPSAGNLDGVTGLSPSALSAYTGLAAVVRFNSSGTIDARNGGAYAAASAIPYSAGKAYHVRLVVATASRTYSAYVTPAGGAEQVIGTGYAFRSEQSGATSLANWGANTGGGTMSLCNFALTTGGTVITVASVGVTPATASLTVGGTSQLAAVAKDAAGNTLAGQGFTWSSSNTAVATVSASGLVTAVTAGSATISASSGGKTGTAAVTVTAPAPVAVASVAVTPTTATIASKGTVQLAAVAKDAGGTTLGGQSFTWNSSNPTAVSVSSSGLVTDMADTSPVTITATVGGKSGSAVITITATVPPSAVCAPTGSGVCRYVDPNGNDANAGTSSAPFRTLQQAAGVVNPGDVVVARNGTYTGGSTILDISRSGTASAPIVFKAENKWGAVINGQNNSSATGVEIRSYYIRVEGFEIFGTNHYGIEAYGGGNVTVSRNHVHDVGHYCTSTSNGIVGINAYVPNMLVEQNVVHDIGRWANGENGCSTSNNYWQNHDHGVYQGEGDNLTIRNNVFYNFTRGWAIQRYDGAGTVVSNLQILNNTFVGGNPNKDGQIIIATGVRGLVITNNVFYQPTTAGVWLDTGSLSGTIANNLTYGAAVTTGSTSGLALTGNMTGDPRFMSMGSRDYRLQSGSPAIDRGLTLSLVLNDFLGTLRPRGLGFDVGAYEY